MKRPEQVFQVALVKHLRARLPAPWLVWANMNQGEQRSQRWHGVRIAMGLMRGLPDLFVIGPGPKLIGIEVKAPRVITKRGTVSRAKPRLSPAQHDVIAALAALGAPTLVARDLDETLAALRALGVPLKGRAM